MESLEATLPYLIRYSYAGVYGLILLCSTVLPFSKTLVIVGAGILASQGVGSLPAYFFVAVAGLVTADGLFYSLGHIGGERVWQWRYFSGPQNEARRRAAEERFRRHDWLAVFTARFLPFLRTVVFVVAGLGRMPPLRFLVADLLSACLLVPVALSLGYFLAENRQTLIQYVKEGELVLAVLVCIVLVLLFFPRRWRGRRPPK